MDPEVEKVLASNDAALIKDVRAVEKGDVTRISKRLEKNCDILNEFALILDTVFLFRVSIHFLICTTRFM